MKKFNVDVTRTKVNTITEREYGEETIESGTWDAGSAREAIEARARTLNCVVTEWFSDTSAVATVIDEITQINTVFEACVMPYITRDRLTGCQIDGFSSIREAIQAIREYEDNDKREGTFEDDFYEIADSEGDTVWTCGEYVNKVTE